MERLEDRLLLAGDVVGVVAGGTLTLTGDNLDNEFVVDQAGLSAQQFRVTPSGGTTINGLAGPVVFDVVNRNVRIDLKDGDDVVGFNGVALPGEVTIKGGDGDNTVTFDASTVAGRITINNRTGTDSFSLLNGSRVDRSVIINNRTGGSSTTIDNSIVSWDLIVRSQAGADTVNVVNGSLINRNLRVGPGAGGSSTLVDDSGITGRLTLNSGGGVDTVDVLNGSEVNAGGVLRTRGQLVLVVDDSRMDDNLTACGGVNGIDATITNNSVFSRDLTVKASGGASTVSFDTVRVDRNLTVRTRGPADTVTLDTVTAGGWTHLFTDGGDDTVSIDDSTFARTVLVRLGAGDDQILVEQGGPEVGPVTTFNGPFQFFGAAGDDTVDLGIAAQAGHQAVFNSTAYFNGGSGVNTYVLPNNAIFAIPPVFVRI
jgi:hypothetical protein